MGISYGTLKKSEFVNVNQKLRSVSKSAKIFFTENNIAFVSFGTHYSKVAVFSYGLGCVMEQFFDICNRFSKLNKICVVIYDYPGCGLSDGSFGESYLIDSLEEIINITKPTILIGFSIGTGVVLSYMNKNKDKETGIRIILLIAAFSSIRAIANFSSVTEFAIDVFVNFKFKNYLNISSIPKTCKICAVYSSSDELINFEHGDNLKRNNSNLELIKIIDEYICHGNISSYVMANIHLFKPDFFNHGNILGTS